ncbi:crotonase/enoyl-CoA hydratase family protein [Halopseudomonas nanhaiensis]|uniref:crotonase/enoyl-CoA hydratase family protein n=1 Tax=Halopseudomonas nanhaiensis TaxID=2830842 RepID=UPI001CBE00A4|nr:crotonase/enoyl-CoA hydratase family protein [Halopseudomonas nanhaiensis]UAW98292.1 crotonase/enoyl-CoA hydratase family protein [Halopseudomonas nanhaiensis]
MSALSLSIAGGIAEIGLDDGKANALSQSMIEALLDALDQAARADAAVLLYGRPGIFSGGYDRKLIDAGGPARDAMREAGDRLTVAMLEFPAPLVIASTGHAMAKAAFLLLLADYRLGSAGPFKVSLNEVAIGMTMPDVAMHLARERIPTAWLSRCALQAELLDPAQAMDAGFLDELCPPDQLLERARSKVKALATLDRQAYRETRRLLNAPLREAIGQSLGY